MKPYHRVTVSVKQKSLAQRALIFRVAQNTVILKSMLEDIRVGCATENGGGQPLLSKTWSQSQYSSHVQRGRSYYEVASRVIELVTSKNKIHKAIPQVAPWPAFCQASTLSAKTIRGIYEDDFEQRRANARSEIQKSTTSVTVRMDHCSSVGKIFSRFIKAKHLWTCVGDTGAVLSLCATQSTAMSEVRVPLERLAARLREQGSSPQVFYVDTNCCGPSISIFKEIFGSDVIVKLDPYHAFARYSRSVPPTNTLHASFMGALRDAFWCDNADDAGRLMRRIQAAEKKELSEKELRDRYEAHPARAQCVRRKVPDGDELIKRIQSVMDEYSDRTDERGDAVVGTATQRCHARQLKHLRHCVSDPDFDMYVEEGILWVGGRSLPKWRSLRGTSHVESWHANLKRVFSGITNAGPLYVDALLHDAAVRHNRKTAQAGSGLPGSDGYAAVGSTPTDARLIASYNAACACAADAVVVPTLLGGQSVNARETFAIERMDEAQRESTHGCSGDANRSEGSARINVRMRCEQEQQLVPAGKRKKLEYATIHPVSTSEMKALVRKLHGEGRSDQDVLAKYNEVRIASTSPTSLLLQTNLVEIRKFLAGEDRREAQRAAMLFLDGGASGSHVEDRTEGLRSLEARRREPVTDSPKGKAKPEKKGQVEHSKSSTTP